MRIIQPQGQKGSLKWLQRAVARRPDVLGPIGLAPITWLSPLESDDFAEYRDGDFLRLVGLGHLAGALVDFWPNRGPQWDALGLCDGMPVLVEAKAHLGEFSSPPSAAGTASLAKIQAAFARVKADLALEPWADWARTYYQYANRLAHIWWLHAQGVPAHLVFVGFLNDNDMGGPNDAVAWEKAFGEADRALGLPAAHALTPYIHHVYPDVRGLV